MEREREGERPKGRETEEKSKKSEKEQAVFGETD